LAEEYGSASFKNIEDIFKVADCAVVATPTVTHEAVASRLMRGGLDVLVEKPIASSAEAGWRMAELALETGRILQVGHLERFNPAATKPGHRCCSGPYDPRPRYRA
jgi:predicted dehydrogenase